MHQLVILLKSSYGIFACEALSNGLLGFKYFYLKKIKNINKKNISSNSGANKEYLSDTSQVKLPPPNLYFTDYQIEKMELVFNRKND